MKKCIKRAKEHPGEPQTLYDRKTDDDINIIYEDGNIYMKTLTTIHQNTDGLDVEISLHNESDGTRRLIDYMPLLYSII